jgi:hypothetical protein
VVCVREALVKKPTAVHAAGEVHDTVPRLADGEPAGILVPCTAQFAPFQRSASIVVPENPTAVHLVARTQDTPVSPLDAGPAGAAACCGVQRRPFQCSASGTWRDPLK